MKLNNRRYIGSKNKLKEEIFKILDEYNFNIFIDLFAGTGIVSNIFYKNGYEIYLNDNLYHNYIIYNAVFVSKNINNEKLTSIIDEWNKIIPDDISDNYFSKYYGEKYFSLNQSKIIGQIRDDVEMKYKNQYVSIHEYNVLLASLILSIDKHANTVGHYESYLKKNKIIDKKIRFELIEKEETGNEVHVYNKDANTLIEEINDQNSILYLDPPYNARQYINFYHVLENLALWKKPNEMSGDSNKFPRQELKSVYSTSKAKNALEELVSKSKSKIIAISYNNTYNARSGASNNKISEEDLIKILEKIGKVKVVEFDFNAFNSGKTSIKGHKEKLYICQK